MNKFSIVVAIDKDRGIGKKGGLPWHLPSDLKHFKKITTQHNNSVVIMGRKTWDSIPDQFRPLPGRLNVVLTRNTDFKTPPGVLRAASLEEADALIPKNAGPRFIIGGADVFTQALKSNLCDTIYMTHILKSFQCDAFFPEFEKQFRCISKTQSVTENNIDFYFAEYAL